MNELVAPVSSLFDREPVRVRKALLKLGMWGREAYALTELSRDDFLRVKGVGRWTVEALERRMSALSLALRQSPSPLRRPLWTVAVNVTSIGSPWNGTCYEFFDSEPDAQRCVARHMGWGNVPTLRPYHFSDARYLGNGGEADRRG